MIYLELFWAYFKIGLLGFGGGYAMLSLIQFEMVENHAWLSATEFADLVAVSQITPGPVSINLATYTGYNIGGIFGSLLATFSLILPSLAAMYFIIKLLLKYKESHAIKTTLSIMKPVIAGLIFSAAVLMMNKENFVDAGLHGNNISTIICAATFIGIFFLKINPIVLILLSGAVGYLVF